MVWRGPGYPGPEPPEPWPGRVEAFLTACAMFAGRRESDVSTLLGAFASKGEDTPAPAPKMGPAGR